MYELEDENYFLILILIPILYIVYFIFSRLRKGKLNKFSDSNLLSKIAPNYSKVKIFYKVLLWSLIIFFFSIALINPKLGTKLQTVKREGVDLVFALDVSKSMLVEDIKPSRLQKSKQLISSILNILKGDRVGIIAYAGGAYPLLPITTDYNSARIFLKNANTDIVPTQGTTIGESIEMAGKFFDRDAKKGKIMIIISDGEGHDEDFSKQVEFAKENNITIYTVGIGTNKGAPIPEKKNGVLIEYKKDNKMNIVISKRNEINLKNISTGTGGKYLDGNNSTRKIVENIEDILEVLEKNEYETKRFSDYKDQFQWFLGGILFLLILDIFVFERKTLWLHKMNLFKNKK